MIGRKAKRIAPLFFIFHLKTSFSLKTPLFYFVFIAKIGTESSGNPFPCFGFNGGMKLLSDYYLLSISLFHFFGLRKNKDSSDDKVP